MISDVEFITCHFHDWPVAFGDLEGLSREPEETLQGHNQKDGRRNDAESGVLEDSREVENVRASNDRKPSFGSHF